MSKPELPRAIVGFHKDENADWVAELDCGHAQHVRHRPPFTLRPWVLSETGRRSQLGASLNCKLCLELALPVHFAPYRRTPEFTDESLPKAFLRDHTTAVGVWGKLYVTVGRLRYVIGEPFTQAYILAPTVPGIIPPAIAHRVEPIGAVRFYVEFWRAPSGVT